MEICFRFEHGSMGCSAGDPQLRQRVAGSSFEQEGDELRKR
jgi:hypothetical protein